MVRIRDSPCTIKANTLHREHSPGIVWLMQIAVVSWGNHLGLWRRMSFDIRWCYCKMETDLDILEVVRVNVSVLQDSFVMSFEAFAATCYMRI